VRHLRLALVLGCALALTPLASAFADSQLPSNECNITGGSQVCPGPITSTATYKGVRTDKGNAVAPIDVLGYGSCRFVDNGSGGAGTSLFVPFNSINEWQQFWKNAPLSNKFLSVLNCSRPYTTSATWTVPAPPYKNCAGSPTVATPQIYARYTPANPPTWPPSPETASFTCHNGTTVVNANVLWTGLDSDKNYNQSWNPAATYGPDLTLTANPGNINSGDTSALTWTSAGATSCSANWTNSHATSGSANVSPTQTTAYSISCTNGTLVSTASVTVTVGSAIKITFNANPKSIVAGGTSTLTWAVQNADTCTASGGWSGNVSPTGGNQNVSPPASTTYTLTCSNNKGDQGQSSTTVVVANNCPAINFQAQGDITWSYPSYCTGLYTSQYGGGDVWYECNEHNWGKLITDGAGWEGLSFPGPSGANLYPWPASKPNEGGVGFSTWGSPLFPDITIYNTDHDAGVSTYPTWPGMPTPAYYTGYDYLMNTSPVSTSWGPGTNGAYAAGYYEPNDSAFSYGLASLWGQMYGGNMGVGSFPSTYDLMNHVINAIGVQIMFVGEGGLTSPACDPWGENDYSACLHFMQEFIPGGKGQLVTNTDAVWNGAYNYPGGDTWSFQATGNGPGGSCFHDAGVGNVGTCHVKITFSRPVGSSDCGSLPNGPFCAETEYQGPRGDNDICTPDHSEPLAPNTDPNSGPQKCYLKCECKSC